MRLQDKLVSYLEYCTYRKELDQKTVKARSEERRVGKECRL